MSALFRRFLQRLARAYFFAAYRVYAAALGFLLLVIMWRTKGFFDPVHYRSTYEPRRFKSFPMLDFAFAGARIRRDPNRWFSQEAYARENPHVGVSAVPPVLHYLLFGRYEERPPGGTVPPHAAQAAQAAQAAPATRPYDRFERLWPAIEQDMAELRDVERDLSPTATLRTRLAARSVFAGSPTSGRAMQALAKRLPARIDHLLVVPWLGISGGSERTGQRLIAALREHYRDGGLCVLGPDSAFDVAMQDRAAYGIPIVAINDVDPLASLPARIEMLDRVLMQYRPRTVHCINSWAGWTLLKERGAHHAQDCRLFGNIYSDVRIDGFPVGAFWAFLPDTIDSLTGVIADNDAVVARARDHFGFGQREMARHHVVRTPVLGLAGGDAAGDLRGFEATADATTLWMSRIAVEKRLDVLARIAKALPQRRFVVHGAVITGAMPVDLSGLRALPNVDLRGEFGRLEDLPFGEFDSYLFTTAAEGMPIAVLEAAQMGLPVIAPDVDGIGEFIDDTTGWLVSGTEAVDEYQAALDDIRRDPRATAERVRAAQRRLVERHSWAGFRQAIAAIPGYLN